MNRMNTQSPLQQQIEATLNSLDGVQRATANPFLFTRLQARLLPQLGPWEKAARLLSKPALAFCIIALALATNLWVVSRQQPGQKTAKTTPTAPEQDFATEFSTVNYAFAEPTKPAK
jgi:hypothetical protein